VHVGLTYSASGVIAIIEKNIADKSGRPAPADAVPGL
jgi:hypothetical protein